MTLKDEQDEDIEESMFQAYIHSLSDECLVIIFQNFTLQELFFLKSVCSKWNRLIIEVIFNGKKFLKLFMNERNSLVYQSSWNAAAKYQASYLNYLDVDEYECMKLKSELEDDVLRVEMKFNFSTQLFTAFLARLFPKIQILVISKELFLPKDYDLLKVWPDLKSLTLCGSELSDGFDDNFCCHINNLGYLSRLNLLFDSIKNRVNIQHLESTLGQLKGFSLQFHPGLKSIVSSLGRNCTHLQLGKVTRGIGDTNKAGIFFAANHFRKTFVSSPLRVNLTRLILTDFYDLQMLEHIYKVFMNLKYLCISFLHQPLNVQVPMKLSQLLNGAIFEAKNLQELKFFKINLNLRYDEQQEKPVEVSNVKILSLDHSMYSQTSDFCGWCETLSQIFPNLEQLIIKYSYPPDSNLKTELESNKNWLSQLKHFKLAPSNLQYL